MLKILILDDNVLKINEIAKVIREKYPKAELETANFVIDAKSFLSQNSVDIMILDICLPERPGSDLQRDAGISMLRQIKGSKKYTFPRFVIAISEYPDLTKQFDLDVGMIHTSLVYDPSSDEWKRKLSES